MLKKYVSLIKPYIIKTIGPFVYFRNQSLFWIFNQNKIQSIEILQEKSIYSYKFKILQDYLYKICKF